MQFDNSGLAPSVWRMTSSVWRQALTEFGEVLNRKICSDTAKAIRDFGHSRYIYRRNSSIPSEAACYTYIEGKVWLNSYGTYVCKRNLDFVPLSKVEFFPKLGTEKIVSFRDNKIIGSPIETVIWHFTPYTGITEELVLSNLEELLEEYDAWEWVKEYDEGLIKADVEMIVDQLPIINSTGHFQQITPTF